MYKLIIRTKYNTIELETDNLQKPEIQAILSQPYIKEVKIEKVQERTLKHDTRRKGTE